MKNLFGEVDKSRPHYFIFRASITIKGKTYYAKDYGYRAFRIPIYK
ncbi:MAG: hypothetical protein PQJ49_10970 [Sphaerochaetaceae bacterium]|nr:hypothetical protein [Sphaerochaetaceae bacterium]